MTIQPSVIIWTVICFCLLMLILDRLLFRPILKFMDARQEKIDLAAKKREQDQQALAEANAALEERSRRNAELTASRAREECAAARAAADLELAEARKRSAQETETKKAEITEESRTFDRNLENGLEALAQAFVAKFVS